MEPLELCSGAEQPTRVRHVRSENQEAVLEAALRRGSVSVCGKGLAPWLNLDIPLPVLPSTVLPLEQGTLPGHSL
jgi:hypothetical protein